MEVAKISQAKEQSVLEILELILDRSDDIDRVVVITEFKDRSVDHFHNYMSLTTTLGLLEIGKDQIMSKFRES